jgi:hypothetical protein
MPTVPDDIQPIQHAQEDEFSERNHHLPRGPAETMPERR